MFARSLTAIGAIGAFLVAVPALAQERNLEFTALAAGSVGWSTEANLRWPTGFNLRVGFAWVELGYERLSDSRAYVGVTCAGLIPLGQDCSPELQASTTGDHTGFYIAMLPFERRIGRFRAAILPEVGRVRFKGVRQGQRSGRSLGDEATAVSLGVGGRAGYHVFGRLPIHIVASLFWRAQFKPSFVVDSACEDCYRGFSGLGSFVSSIGLQLAVPRR